MESKFFESQFPLGGIHKRYAFSTSPPITTPDALNVRPESVSGLRYRGGTRPGLAKAFTMRLGEAGGSPIRMLTTINHVWEDELRTRIVASAGGKVYYEDDSGDFSAALNLFTQAGGFPPLNDPSILISDTQLVHGVDMLQKLYIADWDPDITVTDRMVKEFTPGDEVGGLRVLEATEGEVPTNCPCIARYRGRLVLAGAYDDPHEWFMSRVGDPTDWDYAVEEPDEGAAVNGASSPIAYKVGEAITALVATNDECMIFACPTSLHILRGDPRAGGTMNLVSDEIGMVSHGAWCQTPEGAIIFLSHDGLYMLYGGCSTQGPESLSRERVPEDLLNVDRNEVIVNMAYDVFSRGVHIYLTPHDGSSTTHWYFDWENRGFWKQTLPATMQPTAIHSRRDWPDDDSVVLLGSYDGYIRWFRRDQATDDGTAISSYLYYGPLGEGRSFYDSILDELTGTVALNSGDITWLIQAGSSEEEAFSDPFDWQPTGTWAAPRRNFRYHPRVRGSSFYLKLSGTSNAVWSIERVGVRITQRGRVRA